MGLALQSKLAYSQHNSRTIAYRFQPALNALTEAAYDLCPSATAVKSFCQVSPEKSLCKSLFKRSNHNVSFES